MRWAWVLVLAAGCSSSTAESGGDDAGGAGGAGGKGGDSISGQVDGGGGGSRRDGGGEDVGPRTCPAGLRCPVQDPESPLFGVPSCEGDADQHRADCVSPDGRLFNAEKGGYPRLTDGGQSAASAAPGETIQIRVLYQWPDEEPIVGQQVRAEFFDVPPGQGGTSACASVRDCFGTQISPDVATTDQQGRASFTLSAGSVPGAYAVKAWGALGDGHVFRFDVASPP